MKLRFEMLFTFFPLLLISSCKVSTRSDLIKNEKVSYGKEMVVNTLKKINQSDNVKINTTLDKMLSGNREAYKIKINHDEINIAGGGEAGILYGCLKAKQVLMTSKALSDDFRMSDAPAMKWRGLSLQLMKLGEYNYAITPEEFPFFYDKSLWLKFLDFMVKERYNYIILWNGHPFDYFVKFDKFKEAQSGMSDAQIRKNHDMLKWLTEEGNKRNIKFFFEFYNINTSVFYQKAHHLPREVSVPTPELAAYTEYSIAAFVREFPEMGLFVTPGEGLERKYSADWINHVIFKAVKSTGYTPTIFMRAWFFDLEHARQIVHNYPDLWFVRKYNVEMIADTLPDPENKEWAKLNGHFIVNIHLAANLEPFRWNPPSYIRKIVKNSMKNGANGIHIHPRKAWRWPYGSDTGKKEYQWQRDTLFFTAWSRYSWNPNRDRSNEQKYWIDLLTKRYGNEQAAKGFLKSFEAGADILPGLQRLIWLGYDNHTIVTAGATLIQLQNSRGIPFLSLKPTLRISEYIDALKAGKTMQGQTPVDFVAGKITEAVTALQEAKTATGAATRHRDEANRIVQDAAAELQVARFYYDKLMAMTNWVLMNKDKNVEKDKNRQLFIRYLSSSVHDFEQLCNLTDTTYESTSDVPATHPVRLKKVPYHWKDLLPVYKKELAIYKRELSSEKVPDFYQPDLPNLAGIFYGNSNFMDAEESFPAQEIDFNWYGNEEIGRHWSAEWFGYLKGPAADTLQITLSADRKAEMYIAKDTVIFKPSVSKEKTISKLLKQDRFYPLHIFYDHREGEGGFLKLEWSWKNHPTEIIPEKWLFHSKAQANKTKVLSELKKELQ